MTDGLGRPLPGADVVLYNRQVPITVETTDDTGIARFTEVDVVTEECTYGAPGCVPVEAQNGGRTELRRVG